jgi:hypothetical protein
MALDILDVLGQKFNFTYVNVAPKDRNWGGLQSDGSWNGLIEMLMKGEADLVPCGLTQTMERSMVTDMSIATLNDIVTLVAPSRKGVQTQVWVYTEIFPMVSWYAIGAMVLIVAMGFLVIRYSGKRSYSLGIIDYAPPARGIMGITVCPRTVMAAQGLERKAGRLEGLYYGPRAGCKTHESKGGGSVLT